MPAHNTDLDDFLWSERDDLDPDTRVFATLLSLIGGGFSDGRMALAVTAALDSRVSADCALAILDRYTGLTFGDHYWDVRRGSYGQSIYRLLHG